MGVLKIAILTNLAQLTHDIFDLLLRKQDLIRFKNRSKLTQGNLYVIIDLLIGAKSFTLYLIWRVG